MVLRLAETNVVKIQPAHNARKERGDAITFAESLARDIASGKREASAEERKTSIKYLLELDILRKKQRFLAINERRKKKQEPESGTATESQITPELAKRLASLGEK
jgi:hypothetical protein